MDKAPNGSKHNSTWYLDNGSIKAYAKDGTFADFNCPNNKHSFAYISPDYPSNPETIDTTANIEQVYNLGGWGSCACTTGD